MGSLFDAVVKRNEKNIVSDYTGLYGDKVFAEVTPETIEEVSEALSIYQGPVSIGGGRFSMGGQISSHKTLHLDMRKLNAVHPVDFSNPNVPLLTVQAGATWQKIQEVIDEKDLSVSIMQSYSNFTVGGSLSVNVHGRYVGGGALIHSVESIRIALADGKVVEASRTKNCDLFHGAIGGYGGLGVIVEATLRLAKNCKVKRTFEHVDIKDYLEYFRANIRENADIVFHNADIYPPHYTKVRAISWSETDEPVTQKNRLYVKKPVYPLHQYFMWSVSELPFGKWRREHILEPVLDSKPQVHWRNYEAGYDVAELEKFSDKTAYILQEYFVPVSHCAEFVELMGEVLNRNDVNVMNVSIRHAKPDLDSYLSWSREEVFAFVLYYKQGKTSSEQTSVGVWTRELIDCALKFGGSYYLPYQQRATSGQFHAAYPRAKELFKLKSDIDPDFRFRNVIWDQYYKPGNAVDAIDQVMPYARRYSKPFLSPHSVFAEVMSDQHQRDRLYHFLHNVYAIYNPGEFFNLIDFMTFKRLNDFPNRTPQENDDFLYSAIQKCLHDIGFSPLRALKALRHQKRVMDEQAKVLINDYFGLPARQFKSYAEIGSKGRYAKTFVDNQELEKIAFIEEKAVGYSVSDMLDRGRVFKRGNQHLLQDYRPLTDSLSGQFDAISCFIGLHHCPDENLDAFVKSIADSLSPGGVFFLREHDVWTSDMNTFVSFIHTIFNLGLDESLEFDKQEYRHFRSLSEWIKMLDNVGLKLCGEPRYQAGDPSKNALMMFRKEQSN